MVIYGYKRNDGYPLAAWLWGHRLRIGQHWMEYLLEFLNVLAGFDYELGQGIANDESEQPQGYKRFTRLGLRRFVFYDAREKTRHPFDEYATQVLLDTLRSDVLIDDGYSEQDPIELTRTLFRAFSAIEEQRSWYAKSLFPAHHNFLFWEALRKGATKRQSQMEAEIPSFSDLDTNVTFGDRNFFARGGEIYYLILSAGTRNSPALGQEIATALSTLLTQHNQALGELAAVIDRVWSELSNGDYSIDDDAARTSQLGWIPDPQCKFYRIIADDFSMLLRCNLDPLETLDLLAHIIGFHLTLYIYHRAHPLATSSIHSGENCIEICRPTLLIDCLSKAHGGVIRHVSSMLFQEQESQIFNKAKKYVFGFVQENSDDVRELDNEVHIHFGLNALRRKTREPFEEAVDVLISQFDDGDIDIDTFIDEYSKMLFDLLMGDFRKNFSGVHRKLSKSVGFVAPKQGTSARFVLEDTLLKALTLANTPDSTGITYDQFLAAIYERYGLVVGPREARESGLFDRQRINNEYYDHNKAALLEKLKHAGLAIEYSDATAMIMTENSGS
jgi:hypothetical protein